MLRKALLAVVAIALLSATVAVARGPAQESIALPDEFRPEGIAAGKGATFYVGSVAHGSVWRGSFRTGNGAELVPPEAGRSHAGLKWERRFDRLFVAGAGSHGIYVYGASSGAELASFDLPNAGFINDVALTRRAAYFTDSNVPQLYRVAIAKDGELSDPVPIPLDGDIEYEPGFNANGIVALPGGRRLIIVQSNTGKVFTVNARSGRTREIALNEGVPNGDGILLRGRRLYVVQNQLNRVAVIKLGRNLRRGRVRRHLTDARLDVPTTIAPYNRFIYAVNARFNRPDDSDDDVIRLRDR